MTPVRIVTLVVSLAVLIFLLCSAGAMFEYLSPDQVMVIQSPVSGTQNWYTQPGVKWQGFGTVTKYPKRATFWFSAKSNEGGRGDESIKTRFNDGGHANISGSVSYTLPTDEVRLNKIREKFATPAALEHELIRQVVQKSIYMTGPVMSSKESSAERRTEMLQLIEDQIQGGVFKTRAIAEKEPDPITGQEKTVTKTEIVKGKDGQAVRADESPLTEYGIIAQNLSLNEITYDQTVETQIRSQQELTMQVQTAIAQAKKAEQQALTAKKQGEANAAEAEWLQKTIAAKAIAEAEQMKTVAETKANQDKVVAETLAAQKLAVAELETKAAEQFKLAETAKGEGEAARRKLVMEADGALEKKLEAWIEINKSYAAAIGQHQGAWVPSVVMGQSATGSANGATALIDLLTAKAAKDLSVDVSTVTHKK